MIHQLQLQFGLILDLTKLGNSANPYIRYAQYTCVHIDQVQVFESSLDWAILGALPEMLQTAWGSLFSALKLKHDDTLLIRGGTSSVGLAAAALARNHGAHVAATTRSNSERSHALLRRAGAEKIIIDDGNVADQVKDELFTKVLELVGTTTLKDSLKCAADSGVVCMAGILGMLYRTLCCIFVCCTCGLVRSC